MFSHSPRERITHFDNAFVYIIKKTDLKKKKIKGKKEKGKRGRGRKMKRERFTVLSCSIILVITLLESPSPLCSLDLTALIRISVLLSKLYQSRTSGWNFQ